MKTGRNLIAFQRIEACLKIVTPYLAPTSGKCPTPPPLVIQSLLADKQTLGPLVQRLKDGIDSEEKTRFEVYVNAVLEQRNDLVHSFLCREDAALNCEKKCRSVIKYLDQQHDFIQPMVELAGAYLKGFSFALEVEASLEEGVTTSAIPGET